MLVRSIFELFRSDLSVALRASSSIPKFSASEDEGDQGEETPHTGQKWNLGSNELAREAAGGAG